MGCSDDLPKLPERDRGRFAVLLQLRCETRGGCTACNSRLRSAAGKALDALQPRQKTGGRVRGACGVLRFGFDNRARGVATGCSSGRNRCVCIFDSVDCFAACAAGRDSRGANDYGAGLKAQKVKEQKSVRVNPCVRGLAAFVATFSEQQIIQGKQPCSYGSKNEASCSEGQGELVVTYVHNSARAVDLPECHAHLDGE